jgi:hypothetical protein
VWELKALGAGDDIAQREADLIKSNPALAVGQALEAGVLALGLANLADEYGGRWWADDPLPALLGHPDHDVVRYSPDGIAHGEHESVLLEAKVVNRLPDDPLPSWVAQVQWGLLVTGLPWAQITAVSGTRPRHWRIDSDPEWQAQAMAYAIQWWGDYVWTGTPPPPVSLSEVARWWQPEPGTTHRVWHEDAALLRSLREDYTDATARADEAKAALDVAMVSAMAAAGNVAALDLGDGIVVKLSRTTPTRWDGKAFAATHPRLTRRFTRTHDPQIRITWPRKKGTK